MAILLGWIILRILLRDWEGENEFGIYDGNGRYVDVGLIFLMV